jgi:hypothetical protein
MSAQLLSRYLPITLLVLASTTFAGCEVVGGIFKAGVWAGVLMVVVLVAIVGFIATRVRG